MQEQLSKLLKEQQNTNELLSKILIQNKDPNELLTIEMVHNEYGIGINNVRKMFSDVALPVIRFTKPYKVQRKVLDEYLSKPRDYLLIKEGG